MDKFIRLLLIFSGSMISITANPVPHGFDDEGEISVPRSPKIKGPAIVNQQYANLTVVENLKCHIEGTPTPTIVWLKDNQEINSDGGLYNMTYDAKDGTAELKFTDSAKCDKKHVTGNFSCIAANFLGKVQKVHAIEVMDMTTTNSNSIVLVSSESNFKETLSR